MKSRKSAAQSPGEVDAFMATLKHPLKSELEQARQTILGVSPAIGEGIKWKAPSFRTTGYFATANLRSLARVQFVFHLGAKVRGDMREMRIADPAGLVRWLARDRCLVTLGAGTDFLANRGALADIVRQWISYV